MAVLVLFEALAYVYGHHRTALEETRSRVSHKAELKSQKTAFDIEIAKAKRESEEHVAAVEAKSRERVADAESKIGELKAKGSPRRLTEHQKVAILRVANMHPAQRFSVIYSNSAEADARQFAKDFDDLLGSVWTRVDQLAFNNFVPSPVGIWVCVSSVYANPGTTLVPPPGARALAEELSKLGINGNDEGKPYTMGNMAEDTIWIVIGSRPIAPN